MRYQAALLPDDAHLERIVLAANPQIGDAGGPGRTRTYNLAVMSGWLYH